MPEKQMLKLPLQKKSSFMDRIGCEMPAKANLTINMNI
jgi:hypothetical protein